MGGFGVKFICTSTVVCAPFLSSLGRLHGEDIVMSSYHDKFMLRKSGEALEVPLEYIGVVRLPRGVVESLSLEMCKNCVDVH